jgi:uncharacterized protein
MKKKLSSFLIFTIIVLAVRGCNASEKTYELKIKGTVVTVEVAKTFQEKQKGLMHRNDLPENHGMLFVYDRDQILSFWMKNTSIPLSIAFISSDGTITEINKMTPFSERSIVSSRSVRYALEVNQGFFKRHNIEAGDKVDFSNRLRTFIEH